MSVQNPVRLDPHSEPRPDLALLRPREDFYESATARPADLLLVVEVGDRVKAGAGGCCQPSEDGYAEVTVKRRGDTLSPEALPGVSLRVTSSWAPARARPREGGLDGGRTHR